MARTGHTTANPEYIDTDENLPTGNPTDQNWLGRKTQNAALPQQPDDGDKKGPDETAGKSERAREEEENIEGTGTGREAPRHGRYGLQGDRLI